MNGVKEDEPILVTPMGVLGDDLNPPDPEERFWVYDEMCELDKSGFPKPNYSIQEAAKFFFARTSDWLRWREKPNPDAGYPEGYFILDGEKLQGHRTRAGNRRYTLADIERMAHALAENSAISGYELTIIIMLVKWQARLYKVIE